MTKPHYKLMAAEPEGNDLTFIDCKIGHGTIFYGVNSIEIIVSPLPKRMIKRIKLFFLGGIRRFQND